MAADRPFERGTAGEEVGLQIDDRHPWWGGVVLVEKPLLHQHGSRPAAPDDVARLVGLEPGVDRHQNTAGSE